MAACTIFSLAGVILNFAPPVCPRARAAAKPTFVLSTMRSRSNSTKAAKMPNTSLPLDVVVSIAAPCLVAGSWRLSADRSLAADHLAAWSRRLRRQQGAGVGVLPVDRIDQ